MILQFCGYKRATFALKRDWKACASLYSSALARLRKSVRWFTMLAPVDPSAPSSSSSFNNLSLLVASAFGLVSGDRLSRLFSSFSSFFRGRKPREHYFFSVGSREKILDCSLCLPLSLIFFLSFLRFSQRARRLLASGVQIIRRRLLPLPPLGLDVLGNVFHDYIRVVIIIIILLLLFRECSASSFPNIIMYLVF